METRRRSARSKVSAASATSRSSAFTQLMTPEREARVRAAIYGASIVLSLMQITSAVLAIIEGESDAA
jgi:hypothetical protein